VTRGCGLSELAATATLSQDEPPLRIPKAPGVPRGLESLTAPDDADIEHAPDSAGPPSSRAGRFFAWLTDRQTRRPWRFLAFALLTMLATTALSAWKLKVLAGFENLLPENRKSVQELERVAKHTAGVSMMFVVLSAKEGVSPPPTEAMRMAADAIVPKALALGAPWVGSAESGVHDAVKFLAPRAGLFADKDKLARLRDEIEERYKYEVRKASGGDLGVEDAPPPFDAQRFAKIVGIDQELTQDRYPGGYYQSPDGRHVIVAIRSKVHGSDLNNGSEAIRRVEQVVRDVDVARFSPDIEVGYTGDLVTAIDEYSAVNTDLRDVGLLGAIMILVVFLLYYLRIRTLVAMMLTIAVGVSWTFGLTTVVIGNLNLATGFLFTIVAGNGINAGIIFMARYLECRRMGDSLSHSILVAHEDTWLPTLTAAAAASVSFGSLLVTEFRGFRDFGIIGGCGILICWLATYITLPAILAAIEKWAPIGTLRVGGKGFFQRLRFYTQGGVAFGRPFATLVSWAPRTVAITGLLAAAAGTVAMVAYVRGDPMEYDLKNLRTDVSKRQARVRLSGLADEITGHVGADGMAILVQSPDEVPLLQKALRARRDAAPEGIKPFKDVHALQDFVPIEQADKIPILLAIKDRILRVQKRNFFSDKDWAQIQPMIPPDDLKPFGMAELPDEVARSFTETDGTRGRIVYISPTDVTLVDDAHYLFRWADSFRETKLEDGTTIWGSGRAVIYADIWAAVLSDIPPAIALSLILTILVVVLAFRGGRPALAVVGALLVGIAWFAGTLVLLGIKLNFLNFIALPLTFGIGVDYAVNIVQRYVNEGAGGALKAVRHTGGAVILCSMTTALGYFALVGSANFGVRSLGIAAVVGEICCLLAAILVLPAVLVWADKSKPVGGISSLSTRPPRRRRGGH